ncbi:DEAD/DEAH box helicase [Bacteroides sp. 51]|uniref:DEAD/DEAH box helicase n=1 Tax=Bacteroides sp. 51 TaxID=2302938 RepID=UPI0013CFECD0|nr:DEAD/DEAH box helicase [Bacteroides sp. 51]NDV83907.1 DUF1998 domain-containing protein [Bacteroides sp. 51]
MNYRNLYTNTQRRFTDALLSMWASGKEKEQNYLRYVLEEKEPLLASPVFRSVFPWKNSEHTFGQHASQLGILDEDFVDALNDADEKFRFPLDRCPYSHQTESWKNMLKRKKTIVVTSGTGSGKTECFMIPVLQDLLREKKAGRGKGVQALFLYPLNALMDSQRKRIHAWCEALNPQISYAIFNGNTPNEMNSITQKASFPEITCRDSVRKNPPQILFTNPTMLEYMLLRNSDQAILQQSQGKLRWILLDETHSYSGSSAAELALQLRRVLDAFGVGIDDVNFAATSATIGENPQELIEFISRLTGKKTDDIEIVNGERIIPDMDNQILQTEIDAINKEFGLKLTCQDAHNLRQQLNSNPALSTDQIAEATGLTGTIEQKLALIDRLGDKGILPTQGHFFARSIGGLYACTNPGCKIDKDKRLPIGSLTTKPATECTDCHSKLLEVKICNSCGELLINGEFNEKTHEYRMATRSFASETTLFELDKELDMEGEEGDGNENKNKPTANQSFWAPLHLTKGCEVAPHNKAATSFKGLSLQDKDKFKYASGENNFDYCYHKDTLQPLCPKCGESVGYANYANTSSALISRMLAPTLLEEAQPMENTDRKTMYEGRKFITFTDNRQGTAKGALAQNIATERNWTRASVFHFLSDRGRGDSSQGLTPEEETSYNYFYEQQMAGALPPVLQGMFKQLQNKKDSVGKPDIQPISLSQVVAALEEDEELNKLFIHLSEARKNAIKNENSSEHREEKRDYLKALLLDALGMRPRRGNALESMGLVSLHYPGMADEKAPHLFTKYGFTDNEWRDFLKICLDYHLRRNMHYYIPEKANVYLPQSYFSDPVYGSELPAGTKDSRSDRSLKKWPLLKRTGKNIPEKQPRIVLLLCAAMGITDVGLMSEDQKDDIDEILRKAWRILAAKVLSPLNDKTINGIKYDGYKLDLFDDRKVQIKLSAQSWICPVHHSLIDVNFKSYSPLITGYVNADTYKRFRIDTPPVSLSHFPYAYRKDENGETVSKEKILEWMNEAFHSRKERGIWSDIYENILLKSPVFIAAEHSAQLKRAALEQYENQFNKGELNILSCSTTMEMGIDIGGISEVLMTNVPPKPANYLQRAGRAGRRGEMKSLAFTICAPTPIGTNTFSNPTWALDHKIAMPLIRMESHILVQRNVNSYLLSQYIARRGGMEIKESIDDFFYEHSGKHFSDFRIFLENVASNDKIVEGYRRLTKGTIKENTPLETMAREGLTQINSIYITLNSKIEVIEQNKADVKSISRKKLFESQLEKLKRENLIGFLAENNFIPSAGIPTGLIEFDNPAHPLSRHLSVAISEYAPGNRIVANEWTYESAGIEMKGKWSESRRSHLQNCPSCGYSTIRMGKHLESCPYCGPARKLQGVKGFPEMSPFTETIEPAGFKTDVSYKPTRKMKQNPSAMVYPALLEMEPWKEGENSILDLRVGTPQAEILYYNVGDRKGYALCTVCGKMKKEKDQHGDKPLENPLAGHKHLSIGGICAGNEDRATPVRRNVLLVGRYQTDLVELRFRDKDGNPLKGSALYSLGVVLTNKLADYIGVNRSEIKFGVNEQFNSVFIFDTALGGAGYSTLFPLYRDDILDLAYNELKLCDCPKACTSCLIDRDSQWFMEKLDKQEAIKWLEFERESRKEIPEAVKSVVPDAGRVTANLRAEFSNVLTDPSLQEVTVFVSNELSTWTPSEWPYAKSLASLNARGVRVNFVMPHKNIKLNELSVSDVSLLLECKMKYSLGFVQDEPRGIYPLLSAWFTDDKKTVDYFTDSDMRPYNADWSSDAVVYSSRNMPTLSIAPWNPDFKSAFADNSRTMLSFKITKPNVSLNAFAGELFSHDREQWEKIKQQVMGSNVSVKYTDRYLKTPLACLMLIRLIHQLAIAFELSVQDLELNLAFPTGRPTNWDSELSNAFAYVQNRDEFIEECAENLLGTPPKINGGRLPHYRELIIENDKFELIIRPDGGVENGWSVAPEDENIKISDIEDNWEMDVKLYNREKGNNGILYSVVCGSE